MGLEKPKGEQVGIQDDSFWTNTCYKDTNQAVFDIGVTGNRQGRRSESRVPSM